MRARSALLAVAALATSACGPRLPRGGDISLNGEKNLTNGVWLFGFDKIAARQLADRARAEGLIAVRLTTTDGGQAQLQLLDGCFVAGRYQYRPMATIDDRIDIKDEDSLKAQLPFSYGKFEGSFDRKSGLHIQYRTPGEFAAPAGPPYQLTGACAGATHVVSRLTIGAFATNAQASVGASAGGSVLGSPGAAATTGNSNEQATSGGSFEACKNDQGLFGPQAPRECSIPLKLTLVPTGATLEPGPAGAPAAVGAAPAPQTTSTCGDQSVMSDGGGGFAFDGKTFVIERPHLAKVDANARLNFACLPTMTPAESVALDGVIGFLKKRPGVRAHVSVYCTVLVPGFDPAQAELHKQAIQAKFAAGGVAGQIALDACVGMPPFPKGNGVSIELVAGCSDLSAPSPARCHN